jgi:hypothetical protein
MQAKAESATRILKELKQTHKKAVSLRGWARFASFVGLISISWMIFVTAEHFFFLTSYLKIAAILLLFVIPPLAYKYVRIRRIGNFKHFTIEWAKTNNQWHVLDYLDLSDDDEIGTAKLAVSQLEKKIDATEVLDNIEHWYEALPLVAKCKQRITWTSFILLASLSLTLFIFYPASVRLLNFWESSERPNPYSYRIKPTNLDVEEGSSLQFSIAFTSPKTPFELQFWLKNESDLSFKPFRLNKLQNGIFQSDDITVFNDLNVFFSMDGFSTDTLQVRTQFKPSLDSLVVRVSPPAYLKSNDTSYQYPFERIIYPENASIYLTANTKKVLDSLSIGVNEIRAFTASNFSSISDQKLNNFLSTSRKEQLVDSLAFYLMSADGLALTNGYPFLLEKLLDQSPEVRWLYPEPNTSLKTNDELELSYVANDDYGLSALSLRYKLISGFGTVKESGSKVLSIPAQNDIGLSVFSLITEWNLAPQDELRMVLVATDNDQPNGYKKVVSDTLKLKVPSLLTELNELMDDEAAFDDSFKEIDALQKEREQRSEEMKEGLKESPEQAWRQQRNLQEQLENQEQLSEKIKNLNDQFDKLKEEMKDSDLLSPETMKSYDEYKKLLEELQDNELKEALEQMQKSLENMNPDQFRKSLEDLEFNEEVYKQRLERTIELFKKLKKEANLSQLDNALEKLAAQQDSLAKQQDMDQQMQQDVRDALDKLQKSIDSLPKDAPKSAAKELQELSEELNEENDTLKKDMDELLKPKSEEEKSDSSQNQNKRQEQKEKQEDLSKKMRKMQQMVASQQSAMSKKQMNINIAALKSILKSLIVSSEYQELVNERTQEMVDRSQGFVGQARKQQALNTYYKSVSDSLFVVAKEVPELSNEIMKLKEKTQINLEKTLKEQTERSQNSSVFLERQSLSGINELGQLVADVLEQLQNQMNGEGEGESGSGSGMSSQQMLEQMQQMSGQQQQINQQMQQMINDVAGERLTVGQTERLEQLSKQQNEIRKQLEDLQKNGSIPPGDRLQSELSRLQDEMEDAIRDLRGGNIDELFTKRQQNIMSKMLEAEKSWQERGEEEKREAQTALEQLRGEDSTITLEQIKKLIENQLNGDQFTPFKNDLQQLIRQYFELLNNQESTPN